MITDSIKNISHYKGISPGIAKAIEYIEHNDLASYEVGKYEIDGDHIFVLIQEYGPKSVEDGKCEAHKNYIDIQFILEGHELMGYAPVEGMEITDPYVADKDRLFVKWAGNLIEYTKDMFAIFFPQDAHMPGLVPESCKKVKKAVIKIHV